MRTVPDPPPGLRPADPREWMRAWLRVIAQPSVKCVGMACAAFADYSTGAEIRPGIPLLRKACGGMGNKTVIDALSQIREWGLMWRYQEGSRNGRAAKSDIYRLTFPDDISAIPMLSPDWEEPCGQPPEQVSSRHMIDVLPEMDHVFSRHMIRQEQVS